MVNQTKLGKEAFGTFLKSETINGKTYSFKKLNNQLYGKPEGGNWNRLGNITKKEVIYRLSKSKK